MKQSQIKINLSTYLKQRIKKRAGSYGLTLAGFTRYLMVKDLEQSDNLEPSDETRKIIKKIRLGKAKWIDVKSAKGLDKYLDKL